MVMNPLITNRLWSSTAYLLAIASIVTTRVFREFSLAEALAVGAFIAGLISWRVADAADRWIAAGSVLGLGGLALKGVFFLLGIGAETHDMSTHQVVPGHPLLVHIHHLFFNIGFLCYAISIFRILTAALRR